jgi:CDP-4-dehydro-6-deoxyglucose reductase
MSHTVRLLPSDHVFEAQPGDTLLEAALRAGMAVNYGCSEGNCGLCRARVVAGEVRRVRHHDYVFPEAQKGQGWILMCSHGAASDLVLEAGVAARPEDIQFQEIVARVKSISPLTDKVRLLHLQTPRSQRLRFLAGQSVALAVGDDAAVYPIASCPCDDRNLQFHVRLTPGDRFAARVFGTLRPGDGVTVYGPVGDFVLRQAERRPLLFIACNSGFAPVKSLIEHAASLDWEAPMYLYWLATVSGGHYLANWCRSWDDALDLFHYRELSAENLRDPHPERVLEVIAAEHPDLSAFQAYVAGPREFASRISQGLIDRGVPPAQIAASVA